MIASRISGCQEAIEEGVTGFGFTPGKPEGLISAMEKFLALSGEQQAAMGRGQVNGVIVTPVLSMTLLRWLN